MTKLFATLSKKVPIPGLEYSSQQFSCGLEMELSGEQTQDSIRQNIHKLYVLLHATIDEEIREAVATPPAYMGSLQNTSRNANEADTSRWRSHSYGDSQQNRWSKPGGASRFGNSQAGRATQAQIKAIFAISKSNGLERRDLLEMLKEEFGVPQPEQLSVKQASKVIEALKEGNVRE